MPCSYSIDKDRALVITSGWGRLTGSEAIELQKKFSLDKAFQPDFHQLVDLSAVAEMAVDPATIKILPSSGSLTQGRQR